MKIKLAAIIVLTALLISCAAKSSKEYAATDYESRYRSDEQSALFASNAEFAGNGFAPEGPPGAEGQTPPAYSETALKPAEQERKKILSGGATLRTASPAETTSRISVIAEKYKGWVESSSESQVVIRVPASNFREAFNEILKAGELVEKYETAADVTDQYTDLSGRLAVLQSTRVRLQKLLEAEPDTDKKLLILKEIKRVDDQIESIKAQLEFLDKAIAYSTITVKFTSYNYTMPRSAGSVAYWIEYLDPFRTTLFNMYRNVKVPLPESFAVLEELDIRYFHAETADGVIFRIGTVDNSPEGNSSFWQKAIIHTISGRYAGYEEKEAGEISYTIFSPKGGFDYKYIVGTTIKRKLLYVIEVYFPTGESYERWITSVEEAMGGITIK